MTTRCEGRHFAVAGGGVPFAYMLIVLSLHFATCKELATRCEGIFFCVAGGGVPFVYHLLILCLHVAYQLFMFRLRFAYHLLTFPYQVGGGVIRRLDLIIGIWGGFNNWVWGI